MGGLKKPRAVSERSRPYLPRTLGGSCRAEKRGALPGGGLRRHGGAPGVGPRRPRLLLGGGRGQPAGVRARAVGTSRRGPREYGRVGGDLAWGPVSRAGGSKVEEAATSRERFTRVGPSTVPNRRPPRGGPLRQVGASNMRVIGRRYLRKKAPVLKRVIAIGFSPPPRARAGPMNATCRSAATCALTGPGVPPTHSLSRSWRSSWPDGGGRGGSRVRVPDLL